MEYVEKYNYEIYCKRCDDIICYWSQEPKPGDPFVASQCELPSGNKPKPGDKMSCKCKTFDTSTLGHRERTV